MEMPFVKKICKLFFLSQLLLSVPACKSKSEEKEKSFPNVGDEIATLANIEFDFDNAIFDDFVGGINADHWMIGGGAWGSGNGGVTPDNVFYTEEGVLVFRGNGYYYSKGEVKGLGTLKDGRNTGSVIISKFNVRPGHYEVKMKPLPRLGACTAFWTYTNRISGQYEENDNHEIDIELPGGKSNNAISFKNVLNTNYITEQMHTSVDASLKEATHAKTINLNDGKFHTFGFDWYTDPAVVVYFVDGYITAVNNLFVPTLESKIWLGNWFPNNASFVGNSFFETDYMYVDWVKYIPFLNQPYEPWNADVSVGGANPNQYPTSPIVVPEVNMVANGDFEYFQRIGEKDGFGWTYGKLNQYLTSEEDLCYPTVDQGYLDSAAAVINEGGYLNTIVDSIYEGQSHTLSFMAKTSAEDSRAVIRYRDAATQTISSETINVKSSDFELYIKDIVPPENCFSIQLQFYSMDKSPTTFVVDDVNIRRNF